jgi:hypothetical protein
MNRIDNIFGLSKINQEHFYKTGEIVCKRCNGTGTNPDYQEVNSILAAIDELAQDYSDFFQRLLNSANKAAPCCLGCFGMKKIDWIQYTNGSYKQELIARRKDMRKWFLRDVEPFLLYVHYGEVWHKPDTQKCLHFDLERKCWTEANGPNDDTNNLRAAYKWLHRFKADDYFNHENIADVAFNYQELYWIEPRQHLKAIKTELILSKDITIDRLMEIKKDLDLFWYDIQGLDHIIIEDNVNRKLPNGFKFTWQNILEKFDLPLTHLNFF